MQNNKIKEAEQQQAQEQKRTSTTPAVSLPSSSKTIDGSQRDMFAESESLHVLPESQEITEDDVVHAEKIVEKNSLPNRVSSRLHISYYF